MLDGGTHEPKERVMDETTEGRQGAGEPLPPPPSQPQRRPRRRIGLLIGSLGLAVALVAAMVTLRTDHPRSELQMGGTRAALVLAFARGQSTSYEMNMAMKGSVGTGALHQPLDMKIMETITWHVISVDPEGVATVRLSGSDVSGSVNGVGIPTPSQDLSFTMRISPDGRILTMNGLALGGSMDSGGLGFPGMGQLTPILPKHPVSPGDSWRKTFSQRFPFGHGSIRYTSKSTFVRFDDWNGAKAAVIRTKYHVPLAITMEFGKMMNALGAGASMPGAQSLAHARIAYGGSGTFTMTSWIDLGAKQMLKCSSTGVFDMTMRFSGLPPGAESFPGTLSFKGTFTQELTRL
jgi:hypothetical protein